MGKRVYAKYYFDGFPELDLAFTLEDDGRFIYEHKERSHDFCCEWTARGRWDAKGTDLAFHVEISDVLGWENGTTVIAKLEETPEGPVLLLDGGRLRLPQTPG